MIKRFFIFILVWGSAQISAGQEYYGHYDNFVLLDSSFELDTVINEPYAVVKFHYDFEEKNPGEHLQLVVSTPQSCVLYKFDTSNVITTIVNQSEIKFRVEDSFLRKWIFVPKHNVEQGRVNHVYLKRVWISDRKTTEDEPRIPINPKLVKKPVVYFYSSSNKDYTLNLPKNQTYSFLYPKPVNSSWKINANVNGEIEYNEKVYPYLFWEAERDIPVNWNKGFVVDTDTALVFLEKSLSKMNLNQTEKTDFITYWLPQLLKYEKVDVQFLFNEAYKKQILNIKVNPEPISSYRLFMFFREHKNSAQLIKQELISANRTEEFYLEWGGAEEIINK